jgi:hypothetical protein
MPGAQVTYGNSSTPARGRVAGCDGVPAHAPGAKGHAVTTGAPTAGAATGPSPPLRSSPAPGNATTHSHTPPGVMQATAHSTLRALGWPAGTGEDAGSTTGLPWARETRPEDKARPCKVGAGPGATPGGGPAGAGTPTPAALVTGPSSRRLDPGRGRHRSDAASHTHHHTEPSPHKAYMMVGEEGDGGGGPEGVPPWDGPGEPRREVQGRWWVRDGNKGGRQLTATTAKPALGARVHVTTACTCT